MPATYRHVHTYEQITGRGRNTWKKPEPPPPAKAKQYFILGMEVDYNTYREYNYERIWSIDGDTLKDIHCSLQSLSWLASDDHAKEYPIEAANAQKLLEQIREEIATITGKDDNNMNTPRTAADFIDALNDIYTESRTANAEAHAKLEAARKEVENTRGATDAIGVAKHQMAQQALIIAKDDFARSFQKAESAHNEKVATLRNEFAAQLAKHYAADPGKVDNATMQLLSTGICTAKDLAALAEQHKGNPTMVRIIGSHAEKALGEKRISTEDRVILGNVRAFAKASRDGSRELEAFDAATRVIKNGLSKDSALSDRMHPHVVQWMESVKNDVENISATAENE